MHSTQLLNQMDLTNNLTSAAVEAAILKAVVILIYQEMVLKVTILNSTLIFLIKLKTILI